MPPRYPPVTAYVSFREDDCRICKEKGAQNFAVLRHIALNLLQRESGHKRGIKARRKRAGWDRQYLIRVLVISFAILYCIG